MSRLNTAFCKISLDGEWEFIIKSFLVHIPTVFTDKLGHLRVQICNLEAEERELYFESHRLRAL